MMAEHAGIAVVLGLPFLSAAMIVCDTLFLPTALLLWIDARLSRRGLRSGGGRKVPAAVPSIPEGRRPEPAKAPAPSGATRP